MHFERVAIESLGLTLPPAIISSEQLENDLSPAYERLRLPAGRLELMSGIQERRFWEPGTPIGVPSINSARLALETADFNPQQVGCLIHASVCRDYLEPATACRVHAGLGLSNDCWVHDLSNACLGLLSGMVQIATLIESRVIKAGIVVGTESARNLVESTVRTLNSDVNLTRKSIKPSFASLTIGSGSCAILLVDKELSQTGNLLTAATARAECEHHELCQSDTDQAGAEMQPLMQTNSEELLEAGVGVGNRTFEQLLDEGFSRDSFQRTVCHQVGVAHRRAMLQAIEMPEESDFSTFHWLGNTGSVALPTALGFALQSGFIQSGQQAALLGIGSGINSVMLATHWESPRIGCELDENARMHLSTSTAAT